MGERILSAGAQAHMNELDKQAEIIEQRISQQYLNSLRNAVNNSIKDPDVMSMLASGPVRAHVFDNGYVFLTNSPGDVNNDFMPIFSRGPVKQDKPNGLAYIETQGVLFDPSTGLFVRGNKLDNAGSTADFYFRDGNGKTITLRSFSQPVQFVYNLANVKSGEDEKILTALRPNAFDDKEVDIWVKLIHGSANLSWSSEDGWRSLGREGQLKP